MLQFCAACFDRLSTTVWVGAHQPCRFTLLQPCPAYSAAMDASDPKSLADAPLDRNAFMEADLSARGAMRDSLFLLAEVTVPGWPAPLMARVRNLSPGGMLAESVHFMAEGTMLQVALPNVGPIAARCVWSGEGRFGVAFDHAIEPQAVRRRSAVNQELPPTLLGLPRRAPKLRRPLRPV